MTRTGRFRELYGAGPLHLLALLASFAIAGAAVVGWFQRPSEVGNVLEWFVAAIVLHDLVLLPLYSLLDRIAFGWRRERVDRARRTTVLSLVNPTPYVRIPAILSGLLLAVFFPVIFGLGKETELFASGIVESGYLARWLLATGVMFALSGIAYAAAVARAHAALKSDDTDRDQTGSDRDQAAPGPDQAAPDRGNQVALEGDQVAWVPDQAGLEPDQTAPEPDRTTAAPDQTAPEPDRTTAAPDQTAPEPDRTTAAPEPDRTTAAPDQTAPEPDQTSPSDVATPPPSD